MRFRHFGTALLLPGAVLVGHAVGYVLDPSHGVADPAHGHLTAVAVMAAPLALAALVWHAWRGGRGDRSPALRLLLVGQPTLFLAQEGFEHALGGHGLASLAQSSAVRLGLAAQFVVAVLVMLLVRAARAAGRGVVTALGRRQWAAREVQPGSRPETTTNPWPTPVGTPTSQRGPPVLLFPA